MTKARILLVEDDPALVELLTFHFEREEFAVGSTADGEEALLLARESPPDPVYRFAGATANPIRAGTGLRDRSA